MKISITGIGRTGTATAFALVTRGLADEVVLVSRDPEKVALGHARDLQHASVFLNPRPAKIRSGTIDDAAGSDLIIVTNSIPPPDPVHDDKPLNRMSLAGENVKLFKQIMPQLADGSPDAVFLILTNPVDVMTYVAIRQAKLSPRRVIGSGTLIDTGRFRELLAQLVGGHPLDVRAYILGEHGDSMVPALSQATVAGMKLPYEEGEIRDRFERARQAGYDVFQSKGYTDYAIAACASMIVRAVTQDTHEVLPVSTLVDGPYGIRDVCLSLPCIIGRRGVIKVLEPNLDNNEAEALRHSARVVRGVIDDVTA
ncbi:MAG: lactate dehydrogenase [Planctomycetota bacterium]